MWASAPCAKINIREAYSKDALQKLGGKPEQRQARINMRVLGALGKKYGRTIVVEDTISHMGQGGMTRSGAANAYYNQNDGTIHIALDAQDGAYLFFATHELTHSLEGTEQYGALAEFVKGKIGADVLETRMQEIREQYAGNGVELSDEAAMREVVAKAIPGILSDKAVVQELVSTDRTLAGRKGWEQMNALAKDEKALGEIYDQMMEILEEKGGEARTVEDAEAGKKHSVSDSFETDYDAWARDKKPYVTITVGTTSKALTTLGAKEQTVVMRSDDVIHALRHDGMTDDIIKQIPQMMESPIIVMKSLNLGDKNDHDASRAIMYGNVIDENGAPVIAVLELRERQKGGQVLDMQLVKNAYGKDHGLDAQIQKSEILYLDPDKERTNGWLHGIGLQLPSDTTNYGSIGSISYPDGYVKMDGVRFADLGRTNKNSAIQELHRGVTVSSSLADATSTALNHSISKANENVNGNYTVDTKNVDSTTYADELSSDNPKASIKSTPETSIPNSAENVNEKSKKYSFAGTKAKTADTMKLAVAKERIQNGEDAQTVRKETGWFRGMDGKWRFEIDDSELAFNPSGQIQLEKDEVFLLYNELTDKWAANDITPDESAELDFLTDTYAESIQNAMYSQRITDYVEHDALFEAYPALQSLKFRFEDTESGTTAYFDEKNGAIVLSKSEPMSETQRKKSLIHELQHAVQKLEGFASGSSPSAWATARASGRRTTRWR